MYAHDLKPVIFFIQTFHRLKADGSQVLQEENTIFLIDPGVFANRKVGSAT